MRNLFFLSLLGLLTYCAAPENIENDELKVIGTVENNLIDAIVVAGEDPETYSIKERMEFHNVPGISIAVVSQGKLEWAKGYGTANTESGTKVDENTLFQAGSISKPLAALAALKLIQEGKLDLDEDVNTYLTDWKVPENEFTADEKVTLRRLLTHTAGMTVHGFPGYKQSDEFPTITEVLNGEGNTGKIEVDTEPGTLWRYSGGGYTVMEKVVEDVSGMPLEQYMAENIFPTMEMTRSTYTQPLNEEMHSNASGAYTPQGEMYEGTWHNYPEQAAAGLWTTPTDLAKYCMEIQAIVQGKEDGVLSKEIVTQMLTKDKNDWGLGPSLNNEGDSLRFGHGGKNAGFTNNMIAFANQGEAIIVMTSADNGGRLIGEILRSASKIYKWGIAEPRVVEVVTLRQEQLEALAGTYKFEEEVEGIGDYLVELIVDGDKLKVDDPNNRVENTLSALDNLSFIDVKDGTEVEFQVTEDTVSFVWENRFKFYQLPKE